MSDSRQTNWRFGMRQLLLWPVHAALFFGLCLWLGIAGFALFVVWLITWWLVRGDARVHLRVMQMLVLYAAVCMATLPLKGALWWSEIPILALPQSPKTELASGVRRLAVRHVIPPLGLSRGSFSPDWGFARPYALAVVYLVPLAVWLALIAQRTRWESPYRHWMLLVVTLAAIDYFVTLAIAGGPGLSIY